MTKTICDFCGRDITSKIHNLYKITIGVENEETQYDICENCYKLLKLKYMKPNFRGEEGEKS